MKLIHKTYGYLKNRALKSQEDSDFRSAKGKLLSSGNLNDKEKTMLRKVSLRIHLNDGMYIRPNAYHYLSVGLSAIRCIENALEKSNREKGVLSILDFSCGYGRVLRFLRVRFLDAEITVSEIDLEALNFCEHEFSVQTVISDKDINKVNQLGKFDLIWCGSLLTHLDEKAATDLLKFFYDSLLPNGQCVFTTHGQTSVKWLQEKKTTYGLTASSQQELLSEFYECGYGYADYENQPDYGISVVSYDRMLTIARSVGQWNDVIYLERGWDNHQDVYSFINA